MHENQSKNAINDWVLSNQNRLSEIQINDPTLFLAINNALDYLSQYVGGEKIEIKVNTQISNNVPNELLTIVQNLYFEGMKISNERIKNLENYDYSTLILNENLPISFVYDDDTFDYAVIYLIYGNKRIIVFSDQFYDSTKYSKTQSFAGGIYKYLTTEELDPIIAPKNIFSLLSFEPLKKDSGILEDEILNAYNEVRKGNEISVNAKGFFLSMFGTMQFKYLTVGSENWKKLLLSYGSYLGDDIISYASKPNQTIGIYTFKANEFYLKNFDKTYYSYIASSTPFKENDNTYFFIAPVEELGIKISEDTFIIASFIIFLKENFTKYNLTIPTYIKSFFAKRSSNSTPKTVVSNTISNIDKDDKNDIHNLLDDIDNLEL